MKKNLLVSFLANEQAKIYIRQTDNSEQFVQALIERGAKPDQIILLSLDAKGIFQKIIEQMRQDFPNQTTFSITENRVSLITPSSEIKPRLALANMMFARQFKGVEVDDFRIWIKHVKIFNTITMLFVIRFSKQCLKA